VNCSLIVPWKYAYDRERIWSYLWPAWEEEGFEVILSPLSDFEVWRKGKAWHQGLQKASCDFVCLMDADCWVPALSEAVGLLTDGVRWVQGQNVVLRFDKQTTARLLSGELSLEDATKLENIWEDQPRMSSAGVGTILRRDEADEIPLDPRFVGWGWEDNSWWEALTTMWGEPARLDSSFCYHFHHKPQSDKDRRPNSQSQTWLLSREYVRARGRPQQMQAVIDRARQAVSEL
jgi:Glycosyl transferase family 2